MPAASHLTRRADRAILGALPRPRPRAPMDPTMPPDLRDLLDAAPDALRRLARTHAPALPHGADRDVCIAAILDATDEASWGAGVCEVHGEGFAFLRAPSDDLLPGTHDIYLSPNQVRRMELQTGDTVVGRIRAPHAGERYPAMLWVGAINGAPADQPRAPTRRERAHPSVRLPLTGHPWLDAIDRIAPLGLGARGFLAGPADRVRSTLLRELAARLATEPALRVGALLLADRPEEVHAWRALDNVEVIAVPTDESAARLAQVAELVLARAARRADQGHEDVVIVEGLPRLIRDLTAEAAAPADRLDAATAQRVRRWLGLAGDRPDAGSVTLIAAIEPAARGPLDAAILREVSDLATWSLHLTNPASGTPTFDLPASGVFDDRALVGEAERARRHAWRASLPAGPAPVEAVLAAPSA